MRKIVRSAALLAISLALVACGGTAPAPSASADAGLRNGCTDAWPISGQATSTGPLPIVANSDLAPGATRLIIGLVDSASFPLGTPSWTLRSEVFDLTTDGCSPLDTSSPLTFAWAISDVRGFFIGATEIPVGAREIGLVISGTDAAGAAVLIRVTASVKPSGTAPRPGSAAPSAATPTAAKDPQGLAGVTTDPDPRADFYAHSAAELLAAGTPFLIAFASPAFCVSQACGPTIKLLKDAADRYPQVRILHVEPYEMSWNGTRLIPVLTAGGGLQAASIVSAWQVPVEPWIFTVGGDGRILRSLEGVIGPDEIDAALAEIATY